MEKSEITFEEALRLLENSADNLAKGDGTLEDAIKNYEEGLARYDICNKLLNEAEQKIVYIQRGEQV